MSMKALTNPLIARVDFPAPWVTSFRGRPTGRFLTGDVVVLPSSSRAARCFGPLPFGLPTGLLTVVSYFLVLPFSGTERLCAFAGASVVIVGAAGVSGKLPEFF
jgi:hypothetical protein